jgi:hypothetical protein
VDKTVLEDKTIIPFWYKQPDQLLQSQPTKMIDVSKLKDLMQVGIIVSGDHGGGKFRKTLKVNFRLQDKTTTYFSLKLQAFHY